MRIFSRNINFNNGVFFYNAIRSREFSQSTFEKGEFVCSEKCVSYVNILLWTRVIYSRQPLVFLFESFYLYVDVMKIPYSDFATAYSQQYFITIIPRAATIIQIKQSEQWL